MKKQLDVKYCSKRKYTIHKQNSSLLDKYLLFKKGAPYQQEV